MRTFARRGLSARGIAAGALLALLATACGFVQQTRGDADVSPPPVPDGFAAHTSDGLGYALPEDFDDEPAAIAILITEGPVEHVRDVARDALTDFQRSTRLTYTDRAYDYTVPGAENAQRSDYEFLAERAPESLRRPEPSPSGGGTASPGVDSDGSGGSGTIRGVDVAMLLDDGTGITFRLLASSDYLDDRLAERILGTLYVMA
ncbi:hypothetical protein GCM10009799_30730 [Nocardiopsis rhodophaea]|uniref:Lipoprotein n=1 Tax=Nocardiopsis rhodophaea TaxID=280238 RepID=A0ABN2T893_9ACTN